MSATVDALLPLSFLEAVRSLDVPDDDLAIEIVPELRNKRLGLSDTVYSQIQRYTDAVRRSQRPTFAEAAALARLIGRRPDAERVFRSAGAYLAGQAYQRISPVTRRTMRGLPLAVARPLALRQARRIARRLLDGRMQRVGASLVLQVPASVTADAAPDAAGCAYYESVLRELMLLLLGSDTRVEHVRCVERGEGRCEWRVDWRTGTARGVPVLATAASVTAAPRADA
jgi:hypothetical protein